MIEFFYNSRPISYQDAFDFFLARAKKNLGLCEDDAAELFTFAVVFDDQAHIPTVKATGLEWIRVIPPMGAKS